MVIQKQTEWKEWKKCNVVKTDFVFTGVLMYQGKTDHISTKIHMG